MIDTIWTIILAAGIPSAVVGILIGRLNRRIAKSDAAREAKEEARLKHEVMIIRLIMASIALSEATAEAVQRIPDAHCNGDMTAALEQAKKIKAEYRDFEREQMIRSIGG